MRRIATRGGRLLRDRRGHRVRVPGGAGQDCAPSGSSRLLGTTECGDHESPFVGGRRRVSRRVPRAGGREDRLVVDHQIPDAVAVLVGDDGRRPVTPGEATDVVAVRRPEVLRDSLVGDRFVGVEVVDAGAVVPGPGVAAGLGDGERDALVGVDEGTADHAGFQFDGRGTNRPAGTTCSLTLDGPDTLGACRVLAARPDGEGGSGPAGHGGRVGRQVERRRRRIRLGRLTADDRTERDRDGQGQGHQDETELHGNLIRGVEHLLAPDNPPLPATCKQKGRWKVA